MYSPAFLHATGLPRRSCSTLTLKSPRRLHAYASAAAASSNRPRKPRRTVWRTDQNLDLYIPQSPSLIIIFAGGLAASLSPRTAYSSFLTRLGDTTNAAIVAHRTRPSNDHASLALSLARDVNAELDALRARHPAIPTFTIGHSLGAKLAVLTSTDRACREALGKVSGSVLISFCNRSAGDAVPWANRGKTRAADTLSQLSTFLRNVDVSLFEDARAGEVRENITNVIDAVENSLRGEFKPGADETLALVGARYHIARNLVISFERDELDDGGPLVRVLKSRFGEAGVILRKLSGTHVTAMTPEVGNGFYGTGNADVDRWVKDVGSGVGKELDALVTVVAAFLKLEMEMNE